MRERIWWGSGSNATSVWAARLGLNLQSSTLKDDETGEPLHVQQRKQIEAYREAWNEAGHDRQPRVSVSRSIFALTTDADRAYFGGDRDSQDQIGMIDENTRAIFGRSYAAEPDVLVEQLRADEAIQAADTLLLTVPNQLGVEYNAHHHREHPHPRRAGARLALIPHLSAPQPKASRRLQRALRVSALGPSALMDSRRRVLQEGLSANDNSPGCLTNTTARSSCQT